MNQSKTHQSENKESENKALYTGSSVDLKQQVDLKQRVRASVQQVELCSDSCLNSCSQLQPQVSVVIPSYNGQSLLKKNLPAVLAALQPGDEVIIVDDASQDQTTKWFHEQFLDQWQQKLRELQLEVELLTNSTNLRFAATANQGVQQAQNNLIWLLNNDVSPTTQALDYLRPHFTRQENLQKQEGKQAGGSTKHRRPLFAVGCLEIETEQTLPRELLESIYTQDKQQLLQQGLTQLKRYCQQKQIALGGKNKLEFKRGMFIHARADNFQPGPTAWASGGSAIFDREKWLQLGGFDLDFAPMYWEDVDLSYRARQRGWQVWFEPRSIVYHRHETTNQATFGQDYMRQVSWRNAHRFVHKHADAWEKLQYWLWQPYWWWQRRCK
jgi:GT2 family glycosyltransferase